MATAELECLRDLRLDLLQRKGTAETSGQSDPAQAGLYRIYAKKLEKWIEVLDLVLADEEDSVVLDPDRTPLF